MLKWCPRITCVNKDKKLSKSEAKRLSWTCLSAFRRLEKHFWCVMVKGSKSISLLWRCERVLKKRNILHLSPVIVCWIMFLNLKPSHQDCSYSHWLHFFIDWPIILCYWNLLLYWWPDTESGESPAGKGWKRAYKRFQILYLIIIKTKFWTTWADVHSSCSSWQF